MLDKEFKDILIRILNRLKNTVEELREHFNRDRKCKEEPIKNEYNC